MELRDLRTFAAVVELGGMTRAAKRLHVVQSAVSQAVKRLERECGLELLERRPDGVFPTAAGEALGRHAQGILDRVDRLEADMASHRGHACGVVHIGVMSTIAPLVIAPLVRRLDQQLPEVTLRVKEGVAAELLEALRLERLDFFVAVGPMDTEELEMVDVGELALCAILPHHHPLAERETVEFSELASESWITFPPSNPARRWLEAQSRRVGCRPIISAEIETVTQLKAFVEAGHGIALLPREVVVLEEHSQRLHAVPLEPETAVDVGYVHNPGHVPGAAVEVRSLVEDQLRKLRRRRDVLLAGS